MLCPPEFDVKVRAERFFPVQMPEPEVLRAQFGLGTHRASCGEAREEKLPRRRYSL